jgi:membrane protease YdiL (CAAX protease family)
VTLSKRTLLFLSLGLIGLHWTYQLLDHPTTPVIPASFADLARKIILNKVALFAVLALLLHLEQQGWEGVGLNRRDWPRHVGIGVGIGLAMFIGLNVALTAALEALIPRPAPSGPSILSFFAQWRNLLIWLPIGVFGGGVVEELERIFVLTRFEQWLGRPGLILGVILTAVMFGVGHLYQGVGAALSTAVSGLVFALVFLRRRSALEAMTAHAFSDVLAMVAGAILAH